jgi:hypothetical protein
MACLRPPRRTPALRSTFYLLRSDFPPTAALGESGVNLYQRGPLWNSGWLHCRASAGSIRFGELGFTAGGSVVGSAECQMSRCDPKGTRDSSSASPPSSFYLPTFLPPPVPSTWSAPENWVASPRAAAWRRCQKVRADPNGVTTCSGMNSELVDLSIDACASGPTACATVVGVLIGKHADNRNS